METTPPKEKLMEADEQPNPIQQIMHAVLLLAETVASYYLGLRNSGVPEELAGELTQAMQFSLTTMLFMDSGEAGTEADEQEVGD